MKGASQSSSGVSPIVQREYATRALQDQQARSRSRLEAGLQALLHRAFS